MAAFLSSALGGAPSGASPSNSNELIRDEGGDAILKPNHKVFLSHSGAQKPFVEHLCVELERRFRFPFFDKRWESLPVGENFPKHIFAAINQCAVGVVILSEEFFTSKWPMMELEAMVEKAKTNTEFKIMPVFLGTSIQEFKNPMHRTRWQSRWCKLASEDPTRIDVENWQAALNYLNPVNSLEYDRSSEVKFQNLIVDAICRILPAGIRLEDSYIQGRSRLCKVIQDKIDKLQKSKINGVRIMGLYGTGGIGKTSICKAFCNEFFTEFRGRVCLAELEKFEKGSKEELLQEVFQSLSDTSRDFLKELNVYQLERGLKDGTFIKESVFLALDNLLDSNASIIQVKRYLSAPLPLGSIVLVTTRSKDLLLSLKQYINENNCIEMPELNMEEAKSLFVKSCEFENEDEVDELLIERCVMRCCFRKDDRGRSDNDRYFDFKMHRSYDDDRDYDTYYRGIHSYDHHYHPLALDVLGRQLGCIAQGNWRVQLRMIDEDIFNGAREYEHPVFSILRKGFDTLSPEDQLLFMDVALFLPDPVEGGCNVFEWLGMVHFISGVDDVKSRLESLKKKSLLQSLGDGTKRRIGMHDLWRSFCVAETCHGKLGCRRWAYLAQFSSTRCRELFHTTPSGIWQNVKRIAFMGSTSVLTCTIPSAEIGLKHSNFAHFPNVSVLKITNLCMGGKIVLDVSKLTHLTSLEVSGTHLGRLAPQGLPRGLTFLSIKWDQLEELESDFSRRLLEEIECLKELKYLQLIKYGGDKLPNMSNMVSLSKAIFHNCSNVATLTAGLGPNLQLLDLRRCWKLQSCPDVGDLVVLEELNCRECVKLERSPNLQKLVNLQKLDISECHLLDEVPGLSNLTALVELNAGLSEKKRINFRVPDMCNLRNLQVLHFGNRCLAALPGFDRLISLRKVVADFQDVVDRSSLLQLTKLKKLKIDGWRTAELSELPKLTMLHSLEIGLCSGVEDLPDFGSLVNLQSLKLVDCGFRNMSGLSNLRVLERLHTEGLERVPDLQGLPRLNTLEIRACSLLGGWDGALGLDEGKDDTTFGLGRRDSLRRAAVRTLTLWRCEQLADVTSIGAFSRLETLDCWELAMTALPDLSNFPHLRNLTLWKCEDLESLTTRGPIDALSFLFIHGCCKLVALPDLCNFPGLLELRLEVSKISTLSCSVPLTRLHRLASGGCVTTLPDIGVYFPAVNKVELGGTPGLTTLGCSVPLCPLQVLELTKCFDLKVLPDLKMFPALESLDVLKCLQLSTLSSSAPLPALRELDARGCKSLNPDDIVALQALCRTCHIQYNTRDE